MRLGVVFAVALAVVLVAVAFDLRSVGDDEDAADGVQVGLASPGSAGHGSDAGGASGGGGGPGPDPGAAVNGDVATPRPPQPGVRIPNLLVTFTAMLAQAHQSEPTFVYRAALQARDARQFGLAANLFEVAATADGDLEPFARLRAAQMLASDDQDEAAADAFAALISPGGAADALPLSIRLVALFEAADAFEADGRTAEALAALERVPRETANTFQVAQAHAERARIREDSGDAGWVDVAVLAMETQPASVAARQALDLLDERGAEYPQMTAAFVEYRAHRNDDALARYQALLDGGDLTVSEAGAAWFYVGALHERYYARDEALQAYSRSLLVAPDGALADDARYWRGRVMEEQGRVQEAAHEYDRLAEAYPGSGFVEDARLRAAVALGLAGDGAAATSRLASIAEGSGPGAAAEAARWHEVLVTQFDAPAAGDFSAQAFDPTSYVSAFERAGEAAVGPLPPWSIREVPAPIAVDAGEVEAWLGARVGPRPAGSAGVAEAAHVRLAWLLAEAGEGSVARGLIADEIAERRDRPYELLDLALAARERNMHDVTLSAASVLLRGLPPHEYLAAPRSLLALAYPLAYLDEAGAAAEEFGVPVLLLMALVRQESAFHPEAGSSAGAYGLTQVIPPTGEAIADDLGMPSWSFADLAHPLVSMRFGAYYLAVQLDSFDGHYLAALSAYNGGPGNASRWLAAQPFGGPDGYVYAVDFTETRAYLEHVTANYAMYRYLYAGAPVPSLPHGG